MVKHHAYLQLYPQPVWMVTSSKTIKEQMFTSRSEPLKGQPTLHKSSRPSKIQDLHLVLPNAGKSASEERDQSSSQLKQFISKRV